MPRFYVYIRLICVYTKRDQICKSEKKKFEDFLFAAFIITEGAVT